MPSKKSATQPSPENFASEWSLDFSALSRLPAQASRGLFLAYSQIGHVPACRMLLPLIRFETSQGGPDGELFKAALSAFERAEDWKSLALAANQHRTQAEAERKESGSISFSFHRASANFDLTETFLQKAQNGELPFAEALAEGKIFSLAERKDFLLNGQTFRGTCLDYAIQSHNPKLAALLASRPEWKEALAQKTRIPENDRYGSRHSPYSLANNIAVEFDDFELWQSFPEPMAAALSVLDPEKVHPEILLCAFCASPLSRQTLSDAFGAEKLRQLALSCEDFSSHLANMSKTDDAGAAELLRSAAQSPKTAELLREAPRRRQNPHALLLQCAPGPQTRAAALDIIGDEGMEAWAKSVSHEPVYARKHAAKEVARLCSESGELRPAAAFFSAVDWENFIGRNSSTEETMLSFLTENCPAEIFRLALESLAKNRCAMHALTQEGWILESSGLRKKGDALACAIGNGSLSNAEALLEMFPSLPRARAKETLKYLKTRDGALGSKATSSFENLIFKEALSLSRTPASKSKPSKGL